MQRRHPIAWDCTTDEVREKIYNGMAEELDWTWKEIKRLRAALEAIAKLCHDDEQTQIAREALGWAGRNVVPDESR